MFRRRFLFQSGFSLVELTVATAIFSLGLSGVSMMLLTAVQGTTDSRYQTVATAQASSLAEMILMNSDAVGHYVHSSPVNFQACHFDDTCSPEDMAAAIMSDWRTQLGRELPGGEGLVCRDSTPDDGDSANASCDGGGEPVVKVFWEESRTGPEGSTQMRRVISRLPLQ
jgi:type IV pilus assembly protein PilV